MIGLLLLVLLALHGPHYTRQAANCGTGAQAGQRDTTVYFLDQVSTKPEVIAGPPIRYPDQARQQGLQGRVVLALIINTNGKAERNSVRVQQSLHPLLDREAVRYARAATFRPACREGRAVRIQTTFPVDFKLAVIVPGAA